ncbi:tRNA/rRNA methyltransferase SpoU [Clostridium aceticum]|uniref:tRNA/rRNA methyltransferase SpoU n=1 Tax=Clostridium aceticum TaxID=84022 RepID=A0A0D8IE62_9CLOT|nr:RNA methyltransferase [Clostridium aceticum]AKL94508.1 tRNA/rRNA methyltransferase SpoU [Clostridium aceticum]KJF28282.1 RNA methyltransferase [Clostridium aceticum]
MEKQVITSQQNKLIKHIKALENKKNRKIHGQFMIEGIRIIEECILHEVPIEYLLYTEDVEAVQGGRELLERGIKKYKSYEVEKKLFDTLSHTETPQGIMAVVNIQDHSLDTLNIKEDAFFLILDRIQDPGNMGTIIRTAEAAGADAVVLTKGCVDPYNNKTIRATMGALFHIPIIEVNDNNTWIEVLKKGHVKLIASNLNTDYDYTKVDYRGKIAIIIGNEANGIDENLLHYVDLSIKIPILGKIESLNASTAAAILIYKAVEHKL